MLKIIVCTLLNLGFVLCGAAQEASNLNAFKYVEVETLFYGDDRNADIHGISVVIRKKFMAMGVKLVAENQESWPEELKQDPCLLLQCRINAKDRAIGRQKIFIQGRDCNHRIVISLTGFGNAESYMESYSIAVNNAFKDLEKTEYQFDPSLVTVLDMRIVETLNIDTDSVREYLDDGNLDPIEGIYETQQDPGIKELVIRKIEDVFKAVVLQSDNDVWLPGEVKGYFTKSSIPNVYDVRWSDQEKKEKKTIAFIGEDGHLSIEVEGPDNSKSKIDFMKTYPN